MDPRLLYWVAGASELDNPSAALKTWPAIFYIAINSTASLAAFGIIQPSGWFGPSRWTQVLMAGISAMAFFRTSLFVVRAGDRDVGVGPSGFLQIFLAAADRAVDPKRAGAPSDAVAAVMKDVDFTKALKALPPYCVALMQNVSPEDQQILELMNVVGVDVLTTAEQRRAASLAGGLLPRFHPFCCPNRQSPVNSARPFVCLDRNLMKRNRANHAHRFRVLQ